MMEILTVNPSRRKGARRKAPSAAQKRARAAFAAMARARSKNPAKRRSRRRNPVAAAPSFMHRPKRRSNPIRHHKRRSARRRNPINVGSALRHPMATLMPALQGAVGATVVNTVLAKLPIPAVLMTGRVRYVTQLAAALAVGMIATKVGVRGAMAARMAEGSMTVTLHDAIKDIAGQAGLNLGGMGYYLPGYGANAVPSASGNAAPMLNGVGKYVTGPGSNVTQLRQGAMGRLKGFNF